MKKNSFIIVLVSLLLVDLAGISFVVYYGLIPAQTTESTPDLDGYPVIYEDSAEEDAAEPQTVIPNESANLYSAPNSAKSSASDSVPKKETQDAQSSANPAFSVGQLAGLPDDASSDLSKDDKSDAKSIAAFLVTDEKAAGLKLFIAMIAFCIGAVSLCALVYCIRKN
jgi:hypothetical protein